MRGPRDLLVEIGRGGSEGEGESAASPEPADACGLEQELTFELLTGASVTVGDQVVLRLGDPVAVIRGGEQIGALAGSASRAMRSCITFGYRMSGVVAELASAKGTGMISVSGERL